MKRSITAPLACALVALAATGCKPQSAEEKKAPAPVPVRVAKAEVRDMPIQLRSVGTVEPIAYVMLRPQVAGQLLETPAGEGVDVNTGDVVVRIDPRPFQAAVREAEAALAKSRAIATDERRAAEQLRSAYNARAVSVREVEAAEAKASSAEAQILQEQAAVETARLNLSYCTIPAPFAGRLGALRVKPGAIVKANETDLIDLTQLAPIDASFSIREQDLAAARAAMTAGPVDVRAVVAGDPTPVVGRLSFLDNRVDPGTGAIRLKARFENADQRLWAGQFVNITMTLGVERGAVVVPTLAVTASQRGQSVFVVNDDKTVQVRTVQVRRALDGATVIESGVEPGETVVIDGQLRLMPSSTVAIREADEPAKRDRGDPRAAAENPEKSAGAGH
jgi:membrane fusion protein, multidrug efflux system